MEILTNNHIAVLKYIEKHGANSPVKADDLKAHFRKFDAVKVADELTLSPYLCLKCSHSSNSASVYHSLHDDYELLNNGKLQLYNYHAKNRITLKWCIITGVISGIFSFIAGFAVRGIFDLLLPSLI